ncbi:hypothetical protein PRUPE_8G009800 [Prunus persica]|uniref:Uncharacterized protein n=1 Tax=Prunus persica TaxID=3760 RepID=A0A251MQX2_PRUPE|nr:hypothetical protein PRUPE_8G009800 [Prunus persica]
MPLTLATHVSPPSVSAFLPSKSFRKAFMLTSSCLMSSISSRTPAMEDASFSRMVTILPIKKSVGKAILALYPNKLLTMVERI